MRVLITGHHGFIGSVMTRTMARVGHDVVGLDSYLFEGCSFGDGAEEIPSLRKDLRDVDGRDLQGFDSIVHLAGLSNDPLGNLQPEQTYAINHEATMRLARLAKDAGVHRFLYASSCSIYGAAGGDEVVDETAPMRPVTPYGETKMRVEQDLHEVADADFSPVFLRNATAYGVSPRLRTDVVLNDLVACAYLTGEIRVLSDGTPWRPLVHVQDIAEAFIAALEAPREAVHDEAFNVGRSSENYQVRRLAEIVAETVPGSTITITGETGGDPRSYRVDFSKIERMLPAFRPGWTAKKGVEELLDAYRRSGLTMEHARSRYKRVTWLSSLRGDGRLTGDLRWT